MSETPGLQATILAAIAKREGREIDTTNVVALADSKKQPVAPTAVLTFRFDPDEHE